MCTGYTDCQDILILFSYPNTSQEQVYCTYLNVVCFLKSLLPEAKCALHILNTWIQPWLSLTPHITKTSLPYISNCHFFSLYGAYRRVDKALLDPRTRGLVKGKSDEYCTDFWTLSRYLYLVLLYYLRGYHYWGPGTTYSWYRPHHPPYPPMWPGTVTPVRSSGAEPRPRSCQVTQSAAGPRRSHAESREGMGQS